MKVLHVGATGLVGRLVLARLLPHGLLGAFAAVHTWFALIQPDLRLRSLNLSVALVLVCGQCAWLLLRGAGPPVRS